ncbi:hypothetical protein K3V87_11190, partial [Listeria monocytogenes]|uniref:hypothetical protein n=1 Tax=Listeria monocytogenes TaxID=1639 RepID=UPI001CF5217D
IISLVDLPANFILIAFSFISAGYITLVLIETPPLVSFYMNPTKVFLSYSHFLVAVPNLDRLSFTISYVQMLE